MALSRSFPCGYAALLVLAAGCGGGDGPDLAAVYGTVRLDGQPLEGAVVTFTPTAGGRPSGSRTDSDGRYELIYTRDRNGAIPGEHLVTISTYYDGDPEEGEASVPEKVPAKYNARSELRKTVEPDGGTIDFDLDSQGEIAKPRR